MFVTARGARSTGHTGYTLTELLIVIAIIGILASVVLVTILGARESAHEARANLEFRQVENATELYYEDNGVYPADVSRDIPAGLEMYLSSGGWPDAPWPGSVYDWDNWSSSDLAYGPHEDTMQISIRFCDIGGGNCDFPDEEWASAFDSQSAYFYCFRGACRSHSGQPPDHPGYCAGGRCPNYPSYACDPQCHSK